MDSAPTLETSRLTLRRWRDSDRVPFAVINADPRVMKFFPSSLSVEESNRLADRIEEHFERHGFGLCAAETSADGKLAGFIGLNVPSFEAHFTPCVEIGWRLAYEWWGQGLATEGARAVMRYGFDVLKLREIVSFTTSANIQSRRVMEKLNMTHDLADDFEHPNLPPGHPLRPHVLYRLKNVG